MPWKPVFLWSSATRLFPVQVYVEVQVVSHEDQFSRWMKHNITIEARLRRHAWPRKTLQHPPAKDINERVIGWRAVILRGHEHASLIRAKRQVDPITEQRQPANHAVQLSVNFGHTQWKSLIGSGVEPAPVTRESQRL